MSGSTKRSGVVLYRGPSMLTGDPIVAVATGLVRDSVNTKTGPMVQVWILRDGVEPHEALAKGLDGAVCGRGKHACPHSSTGNGGNGTCYVSVHQAPLQVYRSYKADTYPVVTPEEASELFRGLVVRWGAYGDPAAVPLRVVRETVRFAKGRTGYSHQWRRKRFTGFRRLLMASVESHAERLLARAGGWRTFRIKRYTFEVNATREIVCPGSEEGGHARTCAECRACSGGSLDKPDVVIVAHGPPNKASRLRSLL